jgi:hypothetical protein
MSIGFTVSLRAPSRDDGTPSRGQSSSGDEPMMDLCITARAQDFGGRPHSEEITGAMVNEGYVVPLRKTTDQRVQLDGQGNISRVHTDTAREDAAELFVRAKIWARWADATKNARITLDKSISYRDFFALCLQGIKSKPLLLARIEAALSSDAKLRQFAGEVIWEYWRGDNDPRAHLLRALVREELKAYRATE